jgi:hypothetical protein
MIKKLFMFVFLLLLFSCFKEGIIKEKVIEEESYVYSKVPITRLQPMVGMRSNGNGGMTMYTYYISVPTGEYNHYKNIDIKDYAVTLYKCKETKKGIKKYYKKIYVSESFFNDLQIGENIILKEIKGKYSVFDTNNLQIWVTRQEYVRWENEYEQKNNRSNIYKRM